MVHVSDVHLSVIEGEGRLRRILKELPPLNADVLVSTGDLYDGDLDNREECQKLWGSYNPRLGKFAVIGNHEVFAGLPASGDFLEKSGFKVLREEGAELPCGICFAGVDDPIALSHGVGKKSDERKLLENLGEGSYRILLKHRPDIDSDALGLPFTHKTRHPLGR